MLPDGRGGPHVFVDDIDEPAISDDDFHHLGKVRRIRLGETLTISDGAGRWCSARFGSIPEITGAIVSVDRPLPRITIAMSPVKGDRTATAVQKLTELSVDRIVMLSTARSVVRWDQARGQKALVRLNAVARAAAAQSRQAWLPTVEGPVSVSRILAEPSVAVAESGGSEPDLLFPTIVVGPEGGWEDDEIGPQIQRIGLGSAVLRAETAAIVAGTLLASLRLGLVRSHLE